MTVKMAARASLAALYVFIFATVITYTMTHFMTLLSCVLPRSKMIAIRRFLSPGMGKKLCHCPGDIQYGSFLPASFRREPSLS